MHRVAGWISVIDLLVIDFITTEKVGGYTGAEMACQLSGRNTRLSKREWMKNTHAGTPAPKVESGDPQFRAPVEQPHSDEQESTGKKRATQPRHDVRIQHRRP